MRSNSRLKDVMVSKRQIKTCLAGDLFTPDRACKNEGNVAKNDPIFGLLPWNSTGGIHRGFLYAL